MMACKQVSLRSNKKARPGCGCPSGGVWRFSIVTVRAVGIPAGKVRGGSSLALGDLCRGHAAGQFIPTLSSRLKASPSLCSHNIKPFVRLDGIVVLVPFTKTKKQVIVCF